MTDCDRYRELLGGYVLQALEPDEQEEVRRHLESCPRCGREHVELAGVPALLDVLGTPKAMAEQPPPALEEAVLDRFARERRLLAPRRIVRRGGWRLRLGAAGAVAAAVGALALAGVFSSSGGESAFGHVRLTGAGGARADADLRALRAGTGVHLSVAGLAGRNRVYELWCVPDAGRWISGGTFRVDRDGRARVSLTSAARPGEYETMLVTRRTGGRVGKRVMVGKVEY